MPSEARTYFYWVVLAAAFLGTAASVLLAVALVLEAIIGHGSAAGNFLRAALAIILLFLGLFLLAVGILYRMSFDEDRGNEFR